MNRREFLRILAMSAAGAVLPVDSIKAAKETKVKSLENLKWRPRWVSHLGCIEGCLKYLKMDVSPAWLYGGTGHAFIINIHEVVCPSGPTAWNTQMLFRLGKNIGYTPSVVWALKSHTDFARKQKRAWETTKRAIDDGLPCYGWELDMPEFYLVYGYDDAGYYFSGPGCDSGKGPKPWKEVGDTEIGCLEMYVVKPGQAAHDARTVKEAFEFVLEHAKSPAKWIFPKYKAGLAGFDSWIHALETGNANGLGMAYNAAVWSECRNFAVAFLREAKERTGGKLSSVFDQAIEHYEVVAGHLKKVADTFPFHDRKPEHIKDETRCHTAIESLRAARNAEEAGLRVLEKIASEL